jgi:hypothetical protein
MPEEPAKPPDPELPVVVPATPGDTRPVAEPYRPFDGYPLKDQWDEDESE